MKKSAMELRQERADLLKDALTMVEAAEAENRDLSAEEEKRHNDLLAEAEDLLKRAERVEKVRSLYGGLEEELRERRAPAHNRIPRGDTEERAFCHFLRTGDNSGLREIRASNDTTMNITTDVDGGDLVPTGHYQGIIARRDEMMLANKLGVRRIPGQGTTVGVPIDNEDDGEFVSTNESGDYDRDAPAVDKINMTLVKYTKKVDLTVELLRDEDSNLMTFLNDFIGRGMAKTHNNLLLTEVAANGTALKTFASATVIAVDELEPIAFNDALDAYMDDSESVSWVMRRSVHGEILLLDDANGRRYAANEQGGANSLLSFPIAYSVKSGQTVASAKSVYFGNWNFVGFREGAGFTVIRDPYTRGGQGEVLLYYMFDADYAVLQSEAIGYGVHPSA